MHDYFKCIICGGLEDINLQHEASGDLKEPSPKCLLPWPQEPHGVPSWGEGFGPKVSQMEGKQSQRHTGLPPDKVAREAALKVRGTACPSLAGKIWWHHPPGTILLGTGGRRFLLLRIRLL